MSGLFSTEHSIDVATDYWTDSHRLIAEPGWTPQLIEVGSRAFVGFVDELVGTIVRIEVRHHDGRIGALAPTRGRCPLCSDNRQIAVWQWVSDNPLDDILVEPPSLNDGIDIPGTWYYLRLPCPACRYVDYELSRNDHAAGDQR
ncbi:hypothetical protein [Actinoplanes sp. URMC 104]|uniref:hypothetical protein n=1 Tax=Actinoplanes sp. URMC 104 TaxID=3423409 RepID=UPI003F1BCEE6